MRRGGAKDAVEQLVFVKAACFSRSFGQVCKCHGKGGGVGQQTLSAAANKGIMEFHAASRFWVQEVDNDEIADEVPVSAAF